ncbi:MAG: hypothetical protein QOH61_954 [Chloroflexota bacterium]|jgi:hypothetical protein|nr:hypothetical protein [Chloroflexota bacterium]
MNDGFAWWLIVLGIAIGVGLVWLFVVRLPRRESDVDDSEQIAEAAWITHTITAYGGVAPQELVEEILDLHRQYLISGPPAQLVPEDETPETSDPGRGSDDGDDGAEGDGPGR